MKLLFAGYGVNAKPYSQLLFNCTRNKACQNPFYIPVNVFTDISVFMDLPGKPTSYTIEVMNACDIANPGTAVSTKYVIGQKPDLKWYGVFSDLSVTPPFGVTITRFFLKFTMIVAGQAYYYYSEQYEMPICEDLTMIRGCYPNDPVGADATDTNGIYYGFPTTNDYLGDHNFRYIHKTFLRLASIIEQDNALQVTAFNSKRTYKSQLDRNYVLEFELVPTFFKDILVGIASRGQIQVSGEEWQMSDQNTWSMNDRDSKLWVMDIILIKQTQNFFGCKPADCVLPVDGGPECCNATDIEAIATPGVGDIVNSILLQFTDCNPAPVNGYHVMYRPLGSDGPYRDAGFHSGSPIIFTDSNDPEGTAYEGTIQSDFGNELLCDEVPWNTVPCEEVQIVSGALYDANVQDQYGVNFNLSGTPPFALSNIVKPAWLTIVLVGSQVQVFGTVPDLAPEGPIHIEFTVRNCTNGIVNFEDDFNISTGCESGYYQALTLSRISYSDCNQNPQELDVAAGSSWFDCIANGSFLLISGEGEYYNNGPC